MNIQSIKNRGIKITKHKIVILKLFELYNHLDASQIHTLLNNQGTNISLATIYRVLSSFELNNIIAKNNFKGDQSTYELVNPEEHHDHLICTKCNKFIEFFNCKIEKIQEKIAEEHNFRIVTHHLNLYGFCSECQIS